MERLLRKVLAMKDRPAIVNFHFYPMLRFKWGPPWACAGCHCVHCLRSTCNVHCPRRCMAYNRSLRRILRSES